MKIIQDSAVGFWGREQGCLIWRTHMGKRLMLMPTLSPALFLCFNFLYIIFKFSLFLRYQICSETAACIHSI